MSTSRTGLVVPIAATSPALGINGHQPQRSRDALELLAESEQHWLNTLPGALRCNGSTDSRHRRQLVLQALAAYQALHAASGEGDRDAIFCRWPACTVVAVLALAARAIDRTGLMAGLSQRFSAVDVETCLLAWSKCWDELVGERPPALDTVPGLRLLLATAHPNIFQPELRLDVERGALIVVLVGVDKHGSVEAGGNLCPDVDNGWIVARPAPGAHHRDALGDVRRARIIDPADPLLIFDEDGTLLPSDAPLPASDVWMVHLGQPPEDSFDGGYRILENAGAPVGWTRWWLGRVSLAHTHAVRSAGYRGADRQHGPWRSVGEVGSAELDLGPAIAGLLDEEGGPVHARTPDLILPQGPVWQVEVRGSGHRASAEVPGGTVNLGPLLPHPALGRYEIRATTPGKNLRRSVTLAENLQVRPDRQVRIFENAALMPAKFRLSAPLDMHLPAAVVQLRPHEISKTITLHTDGSRLNVRLELPHCALRIRSDGLNGPWQTSPQYLTADDIAAGATLDLLLPPAVRHALDGVPELLASSKDQSIEQPVSGRRVADGVYRYPLAQLADTVRSVGLLKAQIILGNREAMVAILRRPHVASRAQVDMQQLQLFDRNTEPVSVTVYSVYAPWVPPLITELPAAVGTMPLHGPFLGLGPLDVVVSPMESPPISGWPSRNNLPPRAMLFSVGDRDKVPVLGSVVEAAMSHYLAGKGPLPATSNALPLLLTVSSRAPSILGDGLGRAVAHECAAHLNANPTASLLAAARTGLTASEVVEPLIRSGLAAHRFSGVTDPQATAALCAAAPLPGLLLASPLLPYLAGSANWDPAELDQDEIGLLELLQRTLPTAVEILCGAPTDLQQPDGLLAEGDPAAQWGQSDNVIDALVELQRYTLSSPNRALLASVLKGSSRAAEATLSLGCAIVARLAAQGDAGAASLEPRLRQAWVRLTEQAPALVADDLVRAEMIVSGRHGLARSANNSQEKT